MTETQPFFRKWAVARRRKSIWHRLSPPQIFIGSFALLVIGGTLALKLLPGLYADKPMNWLDALFTATSAVCVTGLIVEDTATFFTPRGQFVILAMIQLGGLGIIAFTSLIIVAIGRRLSLRSEALSTMSHDVAPHVSRHHLLRDVVKFTFAIEAAGAIALYLFWFPSLGWDKAAWHAIFHSVSAFCNAGFSTFSDNVMGFQRSPLTLIVISLLIIVGGIGFLTLEELNLRRKAQKRHQIFRVSIHTRLVLATTAMLIVGGWVLFTMFEWKHTLKDLPAWAKIVNSLFLSVSPRTAGFNNVDYTQTTAATNFLTILLMSIGGAPGSTAGGLKVTTIALIGLLAWSRLRGRMVVSVWSRSIMEETTDRAVGLFVIAFALVTVCIFILTATELRGSGSHAFLFYMFEAVSAFNTVGLSMGATHGLTDPGKWTIILLMFAGRVGPLTLAAALTLRRHTLGEEFRYAQEDVVVG